MYARELRDFRTANFIAASSLGAPRRRHCRHRRHTVDISPLCVDHKAPAVREASKLKAVNESVTSSFNDLCRGVTTFRGDTPLPRGPAYHREGSCGPRDRDRAAPAEDRARRARNARNCYVERLLYDRVYEILLGHKQDMPHRYELRSVERLFQECFPGEAIDVSVAFDGDVTTVVVTTIVDGAARSIETYNKIGDAVACDVVERDRAGRVQREASRVQTFETGPAEWRERK